MLVTTGVHCVTYKNRLSLYYVYVLEYWWCDNFRVWLTLHGSRFAQCFVDMSITVLSSCKLKHFWQQKSKKLCLLSYAMPSCKLICCFPCCYKLGQLLPDYTESCTRRQVLFMIINVATMWNFEVSLTNLSFFTKILFGLVWWWNSIQEVLCLNLGWDSGYIPESLREVLGYKHNFAMTACFQVFSSFSVVLPFDADRITTHKNKIK